MPNYFFSAELFDAPGSVSPHARDKYSTLLGWLSDLGQIISSFDSTSTYPGELAQLIARGASASTRHALTGKRLRMPEQIYNATGGLDVGVFHTLKRSHKRFSIEIQYVSDISRIFNTLHVNPEKLNSYIVDLQRTLEFSNFVIAGSEVCRSHLINYLGIAPDRVTAIEVSSDVPEILRSLADDEPLPRLLDETSGTTHTKHALAVLTDTFNPPNPLLCSILQKLKAQGFPMPVVAAWDSRLKHATEHRGLKSASTLALALCKFDLVKAMANADIIILDAPSPRTRELHLLAHALGRNIVAPAVDGAHPSEFGTARTHYFEVSGLDLNHATRSAIEAVANAYQHDCEIESRDTVDTVKAATDFEELITKCKSPVEELFSPNKRKAVLQKGAIHEDLL